MNSLLSYFFALLLSIHLPLSSSEGLEKSEKYQNNSNLQYQWALESLENFPLSTNDKILDFGCGTGSITQIIASKVPKGFVIGLDISNDALSFAQVNHSASNLIYLTGDGRYLPFDCQFDKAIAFLSMNWIKEQDLALTSLYRALKPNGKAIITRPGKSPTNLGPMAEELIKKPQWKDLFPTFKQTKFYYDKAEYSKLLKSAGFAIEKITEEKTQTYFKNSEELEGFFYPLCNFMRHLSEDLQTLFIHELVEMLLNIDPPQRDGSILLNDFKLEAIVSKPAS